MADVEPPAKRQCTGASTTPAVPVAAMHAAPAAAAAPPAGIIYVLRQGATDLYKVGYTRAHAPKDRCDSLATGNPEALTVVAALDVPAGQVSQAEKLVHAELCPYHVHAHGGREWFRFAPDAVPVAAMQAVIDRYVAQVQAKARVETQPPADPGAGPLQLGAEDRTTLMALLAERHRLASDMALRQAELDHVNNRLRLLAGRHAEIAADGHVWVTYKPQTTRRFDATAFKAAHPELHAQFQKTTTTRTLRVAF